MTTPHDPFAQPPQQPTPGWGDPPSADAPGYGPPSGWGTPSPYGAPAGPSSDDTVWAILAHLSYFVLGLVAPLVIYLVKKDSPYARRQAAEAFNFHVTLTLAAFASAILMLVLIGFVLLFVVLLWGAVLSVVAAVAAGKGKDYRYPLTIRFLS